MKTMDVVLALVLFMTLAALLSCETESGATVDDLADGADVSEGTEFLGGGGVAGAYPIVSTDQAACYGAASCAPCPSFGGAFFGQDAQYARNAPAYQDNSDGTVTDLVTGLMWQKDPGAKMNRTQALAALEGFELAGYDDWRLPTIKELYSLILFSGTDVSGCSDEASCPTLVPFIADVFEYQYGETSAGERLIDSQYMSSTLYVSTTMNGDETAFGVNFADGRIKGYGLRDPQGNGEKTFFVQYVRAGAGYGVNDFEDKGDGTVIDHATGLLWSKQDSGGFGVGASGAMTWEAALAWCDGFEHAGQTDWRLPDVKELQSILDYTRSPDTSDSAALDPIFAISSITNEGGAADYPFFWSSTTHAGLQGGAAAAYLSFGRGLGWMQAPGGGDYALLDVHGAGCQRSDPKAGDPEDYPYGHGPQGDVIRIYNHVRCVRGGGAQFDESYVGVGCSGSGPDNPNSCGDQTCDPGEEQSCPGDCQGGPMGGPAPCDQQSDCEAQGGCPPDAGQGCVCESTPQGKLCIPACNTSADCPKPPGETLTCSPEGVCVPG